MRTPPRWANACGVNLAPDSDAALVLVGHGSTKNDMSAHPVRAQAETLRQRGLFAEVHAAFWKEPPFVAGILDRIETTTVFVVPFFISEGYFSQIAIPAALGFPELVSPEDRILVHAGRTIIYTRPVGVHPSLTGVLLARARQVVTEHPFPLKPPSAAISLFIAGHGTPQNANNRAAVDAHVERIRRAADYPAVHSVFLEEEPRIAACYELAPTRHIVMVPCFLSDGLHVVEDIPVLLGEPEAVVRQRLATGMPTWRNPTERQGKLVWYARAAGTEAHLPDVVLELVKEARGWLSAGKTRR